ncbi:MAG: DNA topoisomerase VI subunit B [Candidatus Woesearchaeota archaeon]
MATAEELAKQQREISIAEFFEKNRHLLGFDNARKALLTTVKEAVDNSLDACEEADILPEIEVEIIDMGNDRYRIIIEDNGPGIIKAQIGKIFAKLLYGSKFHKLSQSRGQQGIGISASVMYGQLTTGRAARITSKTSQEKLAEYVEVKIDTKTNKPDIVREEEKEWSKARGTRVEIDLEGSYAKGSQSVDEYLKQTAIVNPHLQLIYVNPRGEQYLFPRATEKHPELPQEIKPHPYGVELGMLIKMLGSAEQRTVLAFLREEFVRVSNAVANEILGHAKISPKAKPKSLQREQAEELIKAIKKTKIMSPPTDCISPIGEELLLKGLKKEVNAEFYTAVSRTPAVYRGNPFAIEAAIAYGGNIKSDGAVNVLRFANKVPLLYQQGACAITKAISETNWKSYGLEQSGNNLPKGPAVILVHMASVWVPFTSEAKEAMAHYDDIIKEIKLAVQEAGRNLQTYTKKKQKVGRELKKRSYIEKYLPHLASSVTAILEGDRADEEELTNHLVDLLEKKRGALDDLRFDPEANEEYDEEFAKIGREDEEEEKDEF